MFSIVFYLYSIKQSTRLIILLLQLAKLLTTHEVDERELYGMKISSRALEKLSQQEIRDLRVVFEAFDLRGNGWVLRYSTALEDSDFEDPYARKVSFIVGSVSARSLMGPVEVRKAMRTLGFKVNKDQVKDMIHDASVEGRR